MPPRPSRSAECSSNRSSAGQTCRSRAPRRRREGGAIDLYQIWCNLKPGVSDIAFCEGIDAYLGRLQVDGRIASFRVMRRKLGLGPGDLGEFHIIIEVENLAQLDAAFESVSERTGEVEMLHASVNQHAKDIRFALYRDFPDAHRKKGDEKF